MIAGLIKQLHYRMKHWIQWHVMTCVNCGLPLLNLCPKFNVLHCSGGPFLKYFSQKLGLDLPPTLPKKYMWNISFRGRAVAIALMIEYILTVFSAHVIQEFSPCSWMPSKHSRHLLHVLPQGLFHKCHSMLRMITALSTNQINEERFSIVPRLFSLFLSDCPIRN